MSSPMSPSATTTMSGAWLGNAPAEAFINKLSCTLTRPPKHASRRRGSRRQRR
jgi:hypothetical protein